MVILRVKCRVQRAWRRCEVRFFAAAWPVDADHLVLRIF